MKKTDAPGVKTPLFDRIFKPEIITLENGHTVARPRSRTPLIALLVIAALAISIKVTGFNLSIIFRRANQLTRNPLADFPARSVLLQQGRHAAV
ncbi:MAG: hypothetical protein V8Q79_04910 [Christensenellales bacterium]